MALEAETGLKDEEELKVRNLKLEIYENSSNCPFTSSEIPGSTHHSKVLQGPFLAKPKMREMVRCSYHSTIR